MLTAPPLVVTAVAWVLHRHGNAADAIRFLHGYTAGFVGRGAFAALFGASLAIGRVGALQVSRAPATIVLQERHRT